jgi:prepilin-type N-terminal cleavage/methylation domain-containing protein
MPWTPTPKEQKNTWGYATAARNIKGMVRAAVGEEKGWVAMQNTPKPNRRRTAVGRNGWAFESPIQNPASSRLFDGEGSGRRAIAPTSLSKNSRRGFTLVELLVVITLILMMAALAMGITNKARQMAREAKTRSTIAKLDAIIMARYESYMTRRVPVDLSTNTSGTTLSPSAIAKDRLYAIRDLMRMEMPERQYDVFTYDSGTNASITTTTTPITLPNSGKTVPIPAITQLIRTRLASAVGVTGNGKAEDVSAELLYMIVSIGSPEAMAQFDQSEIGDYDGNGLQEFLDGWGRPIAFLRWAPGFSSSPDGVTWTTSNVLSASGIQIANPTTNHDPFDTRKTDAKAYQLFPLIYSAGPDHKLGIQKSAATSSSEGYYFYKDSTTQDMFSDSDFIAIGYKTDKDGSFTDYLDNITNHDAETR